MKRRAIKALIIGTAVASTISLGANDGVAMASENNKEGVSIERTVEDKDYSGFYRGDMSGGDAALGLDKIDVPKNYSELEAKATPTINGIKVSKQLIDINYSKGVEITPKYIVIHDTDNRRAGADAQANRDYFANHPNANASAHYIVDQGNIIQALEDTWRGWHVGDGGASAEVNNSNGIGIELAVNAGNDFNKTFENGVALTRYLMQKYNIPAENIVMHKHASGKTCSRMMIEDNPNLWAKFKEEVAKGMPGENKVIDGKSPISTGTLVNVNSYINIRQKPDAYSTVVSKLYKNGKVQIYGEENGFYKVSYMEKEKGYGYISKDYVKVNNGVDIPENKPVEKPETPGTVIKTGKVINVTTSLNVRSGAGTSYSAIGSLRANETVKITGESGNWFKIDFNGRAGYVSKDFIKVDEQNNEASKPEIKPEEPKPEVKPEEPKPETPSVEEKTGQVINVTTSLNVRSGAGTNYSAIGSLRAGATVKITGESGSWYKIDFNGRVGYVSKDYIKVNASNSNTTKPEESKPEVKPETPSVEVKTGQVVGISSVLNVRSGAGTNHSVIGSLRPSQSVKITGESGNWFKIDFNGRVGYVSKDYIKVNASSSDTVKPEQPKPETPSKPTTSKDGKVTGISTSLNVRSGAGTNHSIIGSLKPNQSVKITGESGSWYKIDFNGSVGYVSKQYVTVTAGGSINQNNNQSNNANKVIGTVYDVTTRLNVRNSASTSAGIIGYLYAGNKVEIIGETGNWYKIDINGKVGYVSKDFVRK